MSLHEIRQAEQRAKDSHTFYVFLRVVKIVKGNEITLRDLHEQSEFNYKAIADSLSLHREHVRIRPKTGSDPKTRGDDELYISIRNSGLNLYIDNSDI